MKRHSEWGAYSGPGGSDSNYGGHPSEYYENERKWHPFVIQIVAVALVMLYAYFFAPSGL